jgi:hypothetical protein
MLGSGQGTSEGQVSTIPEASSKVVTKPYDQAQTISLTENNFLFLSRQKKQFLKK